MEKREKEEERETVEEEKRRKREKRKEEEEGSDLSGLSLFRQSGTSSSNRRSITTSLLCLSCSSRVDLWKQFRMQSNLEASCATPRFLYNGRKSNRGLNTTPKKAKERIPLISSLASDTFHISVRLSENGDSLRLETFRSIWRELNGREACGSCVSLHGGENL